MFNNPKTAWSFLLRESLTFQRNFTLEHDTRFSTHWSLSVISAPKILHVEQWSFSVRIGPLKDIVSLWCGPWSDGWSSDHGVVIYTNTGCLRTIVNLFDGVKGYGC